MALRCPVTPTVYQYQVLDEPFRVDSDRLSLRSLSCACQPCQPAPFPTPAGPVGNASRPGLPKPQASVQSDTPLGRPGCIPWSPVASPPALPLQPRCSQAGPEPSTPPERIRIMLRVQRRVCTAVTRLEITSRTDARLYTRRGAAWDAGARGEVRRAGGASRQVQENSRAKSHPPQPQSNDAQPDS